MKMETKPNVKLNFRCEYIHPPARATTFLIFWVDFDSWKNKTISRLIAASEPVTIEKT